MAKKFFRVATEGATTDGRKISREWIEQMARNYNPAKYGARIWMEHIRGIYADSDFRAYGDVTALKAEENAEGKLELFAEIDPTDDLIQMTKARQKIYTSIEVDTNFADGGEAYLVGLAVTDSPASLGTEMLQFSSQAQQNPLAGRKQRPENLFTAALETALEFTEEPEGDDEPEQSLVEKIKALFTKHRKAGAQEFAAFRADLEQTLELFVTENQKLATELGESKEAFSQLKQAHETLQEQFNTLLADLENTPSNHSHRKPATGGDGAIQTDC